MLRAIPPRLFLPAISLAISLILLAGPAAWGQTFQGSIAGTVTDATGATVPGAEVTATELGKGLIRSTTTHNDGFYSIALLPPGAYQLTVEKTGFEKVSQGPISLLVNQHTRVDFQLKVGIASTTVTVEGQPPVIDTQTSSIGTTIDQTKVDQIPLNGRHFLELTLLTPGVVPGTSGGRVATRGGSVNVNGLRDSMNSYWLDGLDDTSTGVGQYTVAPPLDSVQEFRIETGVYEAKFGAHAGAQVNVVTKSGTNAVHGSAYDFVRNTSLDAANYFDPSTPPFHRNQFGGTVGGPVDLPHVYDGHNRTFFFGAYEGLRENRDFFTRMRVPSMAERSGDFSDIGPGSSCATQTALLDPLWLANPSAPLLVPGNNLQNLFPLLGLSGPDPLGAAFVGLYPQPNIANPACGGANYIAQVNRQIRYNTTMGRVDHSWGTRDSIFFRYNLNFDHEFLPSSGYGGSQNTIPGYGTYYDNSYQMGGMDWTHTFTPMVFNEVKLGYNRYQRRQANQDAGNTFAQNLGIQGLTTSPELIGVPNLTFTGYAAIGSDNTTPQRGAVNTFQIADTLTQVHGNHMLAYGVDFRRVDRGNFSIDNLIRGEFDFTGLVTNGLNQIPAALLQQAGCAPPSCLLGNGVADALLGLATDWINGFQQYVSGYFGEYDFFGQDDWKVRHNLTLNLGLRYEYKGLTNDKYNHFANFDLASGLLMVAGNSSVTLEQPALDPSTGTVMFTPVGTRNLGSTAENRSLQHPDLNNFGPRFGLAWQPFGDSNTVIRAGYGAFFNQTYGDVYFQKSNNPPFVRITTGNIGGVLPNILGGQLPLGSGALIQTALTGAAVPVFPTLSPFQINFNDATIHDWSFDVQRQLGGSWLVDLGYVGTRGLDLPRQTDPNQPLNGNPALCAAGCPRPYPLLGGFSYTESSASSIYHALQVKAERHYARGLAVLGTYTYSKSIDDASDSFPNDRNANFPQNSRNLAAERGLSDFDFRHRLSGAYVWDLPFGYHLWKTDYPALNYFIRSWQLSGVFTAESGPHFTPQVSGNISGADEQQTVSSSATDRPNVTGSGFYPAKPSPNQWVLPSAFSIPASLTFGNAGRNILTGQGLASWDFSVLRRFRFTETTGLEFRAEMFNVLNRANFDIPQRDLASPSFGRIFNTVQPVAGLASGGPGDPREIQFGLKLYW